MKITYRDQTLELDPVEGETIAEFAARVAEHVSVDVRRISLFFTPRPGLLKAPFDDRRLADVVTAKTRIRLVGAPDAEVKKLDGIMQQQQQQQQQRQQQSRPRAVQASKYRDWRREQEEARYGFQAIEPLAYLPNPERSRRFLQRLAADPGIRASMRKHRFSVGLLTEMDPAEHTAAAHGGAGVARTLGLNRNRGEVIELRLRTDAYDGYRDYRVIRKTLCHELSHNVWGDHDRNFWDLTRQIEREVELNDTRHGGHRLVADAEFYNPDDVGGDDDDHHDHGGWTGGDYVLGRSKAQNANDNDDDGQTGLSRREVMARAAMARMKIHQDRQKESNDKEASASDGPS